jgi:hypothetical protein
MKWISDFYEEHDVIINLLAFIVISFLLIAGFVALTQSESCDAYADMGITVQYNFWTGCMAQHPVFGWMPTSEYFKVLNLNIPQ